MRSTRFAVLAVAVAALVGLVAPPAGASSAPQPVLSAIGSWSTDHPQGGISLQVDAQHGRDGATRLFLFVTEEHCDTAHDQMVFRSYSSDGPTPAAPPTSTAGCGTRRWAPGSR